MARNTVQFQKGLSEPEFERQYGTEEQCRATVVASRWPNGFESLCLHPVWRSAERPGLPPLSDPRKLATVKVSTSNANRAFRMPGLRWQAAQRGEVPGPL